MKGRTAIVTGAASGIGRAIATDLAAQGVRVLFADVNVEEGERVAADFSTGAFQRADTAKQSDCDALVARAVRDFGGVDILVNNAGLQHVAPVEEFPVETWERLVRIMLFGAFYLTRAALPHMYKKGWGRIVNIASVHGLVASPYKSAYVAAKHGLVGFTKAVGKELIQQGVRVNAIAPGHVGTETLQGSLANRRRAIAQATPARRLGRPEEMAATVAFLASDDASYFVGATLSPNGGSVTF